MLTAKEVFQMECQLYDSITKEFIKSGGQGTQDDEAYFKAFSAVQALRIHLEGKKRQK